MEKYQWMRPQQRQLYDSLCREFKFRKLSDIGKFLGLKNPYHGTKVIFEAARINHYLLKLIEVKKEANEQMRSLELAHAKISSFKATLNQSINNLSKSLAETKELRNLINKK
jgi:hypothetical protein